VAVASIAVAGVVAVWVPRELGPNPDLAGAWSPYDQPARHAVGYTRPLFTGGVLDAATQYGTRYAPAVVVPYLVERNTFVNTYSSVVLSKLLSFQRSRPDASGATDLCQAVEQVAGTGDAVVLTRHPGQARLAMVKGCPGRAPVVVLRGNY
jgi:hypothetical protein